MELAKIRWNCEKNEKAKITLLHGMGGTGALWRPIAASLEDEFSILAPDQRGHGKSLLPAVTGGRSKPSYTPIEYGRDIIDTLGSESFYPTYYVGHSMGVRTATAAAHLKPEWCNGLVLIDLGFSGVAGGGLGEGLQSFLKVLPERFNSREEARTFMNANCPDPSIAQYLMAVSVLGSDGSIVFPFDHGALIETIQAARDASVRTWIKEMGELEKPVLVLRGGNSFVFSKELYEEERDYFKRYSTIVFEEFENAGHGLPFEQRLKFVARLKKFIDSIQASS